MLDEDKSEARAIAQDLTVLAYVLAGEKMNIVFRRYGLETKNITLLNRAFRPNSTVLDNGLRRRPTDPPPSEPEHAR